MSKQTVVMVNNCGDFDLSLGSKLSDLKFDIVHRHKGPRKLPILIGFRTIVREYFACLLGFHRLPYCPSMSRLKTMLMSLTTGHRLIPKYFTNMARVTRS